MTSSALVILGMHRSGTSRLAGSPEKAGLALGPGLVPPASGFSFFETQMRRNAGNPEASLPAPAQDVCQQLLERSDDLNMGPLAGMDI